MAYRVVLIENEVSMKLKLNNLIVDRGDEDEIWIHLDDISMIVLDNPKLRFTVRLMSALAEHNIGVIFCDNNHLPIGFYGSYDNHSRVSKNIGYQIEKSNEFYDTIWKKIVCQKILNQQQVLNNLEMSDEIQDKLLLLSNEVLAGDPSNREAHAAKIYFNTLMNNSFSRGNDDIILNSALDYGYSIIRSYLAKACVGYGMNTQIGIHHRNEFNRFNLVDDLMEPFRPFVDIYAYKIMGDEEYFKPEHRRKLINIVNHKIYYANKNMHLGNAIDTFVEQYAAYISGKRENIEMPLLGEYIGAEGDE